jgi:hypothetical protein
MITSLQMKDWNRPTGRMNTGTSRPTTGDGSSSGLSLDLCAWASTSGLPCSRGTYSAAQTQAIRTRGPSVLRR